MLQHEVTWIVVEACGGMVADFGEKALERVPIEEIGAGMQFVTERDAKVAREIEQGAPAPCELGESFVDEAGRTLRPWISQVPRETAGKHGHAGCAQIGGGTDRFLNCSVAHAT